MVNKDFKKLDVTYDDKQFRDIIDPYEWNQNFKKIEEIFNENVELMENVSAEDISVDFNVEDTDTVSLALNYLLNGLNENAATDEENYDYLNQKHDELFQHFTDEISPLVSNITLDVKTSALTVSFKDGSSHVYYIPSGEGGASTVATIPAGTVTSLVFGATPSSAILSCMGEDGTAYATFLYSGYGDGGEAKTVVTRVEGSEEILYGILPDSTQQQLGAGMAIWNNTGVNILVTALVLQGNLPFSVSGSASRATVKPYEWKNPPLVNGVEYRTTERVGDLAVYIKNVDGVINYRLDGETEYKPYAELAGAANKTHASQHATGGSDPITPAAIGAAPAGYGEGTKQDGSKIRYQALNQLGWFRVCIAARFAAAIVDINHHWSLGGPSSLTLLVTLDNYCPSLKCLKYQGASGQSYIPIVRDARIVNTASDTYALDIFYHNTGVNDVTINVVNVGPNQISLQAPVFIASDDTLPDGETILGSMEWENPPLLSGVEYRTTERIAGTAVYKKNVDGVIYYRLDGETEYKPYAELVGASFANAGSHNSIYRGKYLGSAVTDAQWAAIKAGTFDDMYIGDYWTINDVTYRIAAFDYYYRTGDTNCTHHHVVLVPDTALYNHVMNDTNITTGAYVGSKLYTEGLTQAKETINAAFGSAHILNHRQYLQNAVTNDYASGGSWYDSTVELMTEQNVYGCKIYGNVSNGTALPNNYTVDKSQYPLFAFRPDMISNGEWFWLRDVVSATRFADVRGNGAADYYAAADAAGVRPEFSIYSA